MAGYHPVIKLLHKNLAHQELLMGILLSEKHLRKGMRTQEGSKGVLDSYFVGMVEGRT